ncbi:hypothetical protein DW068_13700 [Anaerobutyricum hallii]|uniref:Uncharacterized protein n=1 Tax=Anaerobutyricum hallii TaxID=39488 RepID=A0A415G4E7_9FIRM|nr:hypothetical protein DW068_13700 [Anaerobutyricum hallii]
MKNHFSNMHAPTCGIFCFHSVDVVSYAALIQEKYSTNYNAHLTESIFQTRSSVYKLGSLQFNFWTSFLICSILINRTFYWR